MWRKLDWLRSFRRLHQHLPFFVLLMLHKKWGNPKWKVLFFVQLGQWISCESVLENFDLKGRSSDSSTLIDKGSVWVRNATLSQWENEPNGKLIFFSKLIACVCYSINRYFPEVVFYGQYFRKILSHKKMNFHSAVSPDQIPLHKVSEFYYRFVPRYISRPYMQFEQWSHTLNEINNHQYEVAAFSLYGEFLALLQWSAVMLRCMFC